MKILKVLVGFMSGLTATECGLKTLPPVVGDVRDPPRSRMIQRMIGEISKLFSKLVFLLVLNVGNGGMIHKNYEESSQQPPFPAKHQWVLNIGVFPPKGIVIWAVFGDGELSQGFSYAPYPPWSFSYPQLEVSWNGDTPKSSMLIGFSIANHPFWGVYP